MVHDMANHESSMEIDDRTICAISNAKDNNCSSQTIPNLSVFISKPSFYLGVWQFVKKSEINHIVNISTTTRVRELNYRAFERSGIGL